MNSLRRIKIKSQLAREVLAEFAGTFILLVRQSKFIGFKDNVYANFWCRLLGRAALLKLY